MIPNNYVCDGQLNIWDYLGMTKEEPKEEPEDLRFTPAWEPMMSTLGSLICLLSMAFAGRLCSIQRTPDGPGMPIHNFEFSTEQKASL